jgi:GNAT superfamily N-acetyltransferase
VAYTGLAVMDHSHEIAISICPAQRSDLDAINAVVEAAVLHARLPEPVQYQTLSDSHFEPIDLDETVLLLALSARDHILGVAACSHGRVWDSAAGLDTLLLEGPYVHPRHTHQGIGSQLLAEAVALARRQGCDGLMVKACGEAEGFFLSHGLEPLPETANDPMRHYWRSCQ